MSWESLALHKPGLLVTGTDTDVGKTVVSCGVAWALRHQRPGAAVGVCKPFASGCRKDRGGLVAPDAEALAHFADCRLPLEVVNPIRYRDPLAPAVAAEQQGEPTDWDAVGHALTRLDQHSDVVVVEGVGGLMVPLDPAVPSRTVLDLAAHLDYPVLVVARSGLGTLNHTAMTVALLKVRGIRVAGVVMNGYAADEALAMADDPSRGSNRNWLRKLTGTPVVAVAPQVDPKHVAPEEGRIDPVILEELATTNWWQLAKPPGMRKRVPTGFSP
ncbi:MAG: dethiobiotin synthase [Planctomycetota bacterium]